MRSQIVLSLGLAPTVFLMGCGPGHSKDMVASAISPDGQIEAVVYEINGGATTSFGYEVDMRKMGDATGADVAELYGALRNENAFGVNLRWDGPGALHIEYFRAKSIDISVPTATVNGRKIQVILDSGITDPAAPDGGMLRNLHRK